jgi:hypothetical protein
MGNLVHQIVVGLAIDMAKGGVRQREDIDVPHFRFGYHFALGQLHGLGGGEMAGADESGQDQKTRSGHGIKSPPS